MQTSYPLKDRLGRPGHPYSGEASGKTRIAEVALRPGDLGIRGTAATSEGKGVKKLIAPAAADADAIIATIGSTAGTQTLSGVALDGVIGGGLIFPPRNVVLVVDAHTDWDPTTAIVTGEDPNGRVQTEDLAIATNGTATGTKSWRKITSLYIPAQTGAGGTAVLGTGTLIGPLTSRDVLGIVSYKAAKQLATGGTTEYEQYETLVVWHEGPVWVEVEEDVLDGEQVYVRLVAAGAEVVGGLRNDRDGTTGAPDAVPVIGMRFLGDSTTRDSVKVAVVEFDMQASA